MQRNTLERSRSELRIECGTAYNWDPQRGGPRILGEGLPCKLIYRTKGQSVSSDAQCEEVVRGPGVGEQPNSVSEVSQIKTALRRLWSKRILAMSNNG
jgi:hypothetical protein